VATKTGWHRYESKLRHCRPTYANCCVDADTCSSFSYLLPCRLSVKTASSDNAPSISKSFVALPAAPAAVVNGNADAALVAGHSQPSTMATVDEGGSWPMADLS